MWDTASEITSAITEKEGELILLRTRMEDDFDLWALTPYESKDATGKIRKGYQAYTSSAPRNFFDKIQDGLNQAALSIQIKLGDDASAEERRRASKGELYLFGALNAIDRRLLKRGEPPLREALGHLICLRGWYALRALVYVPKGGKETVFDVQAWDPLHVTWEVGSNGLLWGAYKRQATKAQIESEYGFVIKGKDAELVDFWDTERNSVIIEGAFAKSPTPHNIGRVPLMVGAVGSTPTIQRRTLGASALEYRGDSVWASARDLFEPYNKYVSRMMDVMERAVVGSIKHPSRLGNKTLASDPFLTWQEIQLEEGEDVVPLEMPRVPPEITVVLGIISQDLQQSTLPFPLAYGGTTQGLSGRALAKLADATRSVYNPGTESLARSYTWLCEELLAQFVQKGNKKRELYGYKPEGEFFQVQVKPTEINPNWYIQVRVEPRLPRDEQGEIMMALAATQKRAPDDIALMSKATAREHILKLRDPDAEEDKVLEEMGKALPPIVAVNIAAALKRRGENELAEQVMMLLRPQGAGATQAPPLPPELLKAIITVLVQSGQPQLAEALLKVLGGKPAPLVGEPPQGVPSPVAGATVPVEGPSPGGLVAEQAGLPTAKQAGMAGGVGLGV